LIGICIHQGDVVAVKMAEDNIRGKLPGLDDLFPDYLVHRHLNRVRRPTITKKSQSDPRIDKNLVVADSHKTTQSPDTK